MQISKISIQNFRLLSDIELGLESNTTLIVGRNNSGKTSLSEVVRRFLSEGTTFDLEDFSNSCVDQFSAARDIFASSADEVHARELIPSIELRITVSYDPTKEELGPLAPFIINVEPTCTEAVFVASYELKSGRISNLLTNLPDPASGDSEKEVYIAQLKERIPREFSAKIWVEDSLDPKNKTIVSQNALRAVIKTGYINAQRGLDDVTSADSDVLAKVVERLFKTASSQTADEADGQIASALLEAVSEIQSQLNNDFRKQLKGLVPTLNNFNYPGLHGQELDTETKLDVNRLVSNFTKVRYTGYGGINFPETYNGLGMRNLIFILLQLVGFYKSYRAEPLYPCVHLIFIEEPEAHLHPQMQEVFIDQLGEIASQLMPEGEDKWPVQFVVSTHSSHLANSIHFESIRYFFASNSQTPGIRATTVRDLRQGLTGVPDASKEFLHQYLTLTKCDLFFADKAVLVEGVTERILLKPIIKKLEELDPEAPKLSTQYLTVMEVDGAHAHKFFDLLDFLDLKALIITDLDAVTVPGGTACVVHLGTYSSNACLRSWFSDDQDYSLASLLQKTEEQRIKDRKRIAYQRPEAVGGPCGRTFEDAFILANQPLFEIATGTSQVLEESASLKAGRFKKSQFALKYAIEVTSWNVPTYISEGIRWLAAE